MTPIKNRERRSITFPLWSVLIVPFVVQIALAVGLVGYLSFRYGQAAVSDIAQQLHAEIAYRIEEHVRTFLSTPHYINQINAAAMQQGWLAARSPETLERHFWEQVQIFDSVTSIYFGNTAGGLVNAGREGAEGALYVILTDAFVSGPFNKYATGAQGEHIALLATVPNFDARTRPWYTSAVEEGDGAWSELYVLFTGQDMAIAASRPVYDHQSRLLGVVSVDLFTSHLSDFLGTTRISQNGVSFIMERSGLLIASSTDEQPFIVPDNGEAPQRLHARESAIPIIRDAAEFLTGRYGDYDAITGEHRFEYTIGGKRQFLHVLPVQDDYGIDWLVVVVVPEADFMGQIIAGNRLNIALIVAASLLAVGLGLVTAGWVDQSMVRLNVSTQALARGDWQQIAPLEPIRETVELTHSFNTMARQLQQMLQNLTAEVTERTRVEESLRANEQMLESIFSLVPVGICLTDMDGHYLRVNEEYCRIFGYSKKELLGQHFSMILLPERVETGVDNYARLLKGEVHFPRERERLRRDGSRVYVDAASAVLYAEDGSISVIHAVRDITPLKQAELERERLLAQIQEQARRMQQIVDTVPEGVIVLDADGRITLVNPLGEKELQPLTQARAGDVLTHLGERPLTDFLTYPAYQGWHEVTVEKRVFQIIARPLVSDSATQSHVLVIRNMTWQREIERRVQQQERLAAVGQLAAGIAHDFNNVMASILLYAQMMSRTESLTTQGQDRMTTIIQQVHHASRMIQQILDFSRQAVLRRQLLDLLALLKEEVKLLECTLPENIEIALTYSDALCLVHADPTRIRQLVMNLAVNARDAMLHGGELRISLDRVEVGADAPPSVPDLPPSAWMKIAVTDTGTGIPDDVLPRIFEPFFTTKAPLGSGLGLAQVHGIVEQHEGRIGVDTCIGKGTTITIYLPCLPETVAPSPMLTDGIVVAEGSEARLILVVEDDRPVRNALTESLALLNYRVLEVAHGEEALRILEMRGDEIDLIVSDVVMPKMGGIALFHALQKKGIAVPMILLTGHPLQREVEELCQQGLKGWLLKPPDMEQLAQVVASALNQEPDPSCTQ
jgi:PAS domain S-box-containing protein